MSHFEDKQGNVTEVRDNPDKGRFEIIYSDAAAEKPAGSTYYLDRDGDRIFYHTIVGEEFGGRGLAGILVKFALEQTAEAGLTLVPVCPYVKGYVEKKGEVGPTRTPTKDDLAYVQEHTS